MPFDTSKLSNFVRSRKDESAAFSIPPITEAYVVGYLLKIDSNKSTGFDGTPEVTVNQSEASPFTTTRC